MTSFFSCVSARSSWLSTVITLVSADHDLNMQCKVSVKFVAIDTWTKTAVSRELLRLCRG